MSHDTEEHSIQEIEAVCQGLLEVLSYKNLKYGNSALEPMQVFSTVSAEQQICNRIDDKLSRIKNSGEPKKNDVFDTMGYLALYCVKKGWLTFDEFMD